MTHDAILEAATQILSSEGLKGFNTNAIAARAGTSIGTVYQYFPNKDALMLALVHRQKQAMLDDVAREMASSIGGDLESTVGALMRAVTRHARRNTRLASALDHEEARLPIASVVDDYIDRAGDLFMNILGRDESVVGADYRRAARTIPTIVQAIMDQWSGDGQSGLEMAEAEAVRAVLGYLRG